MVVRIRVRVAKLALPGRVVKVMATEGGALVVVEVEEEEEPEL